MSNRFGGEIAGRPLHFIWIADCSASMTLDGKIQGLNNAIREALPRMREVVAENPSASVYLRTLRFASGARWLQPAAVRLDEFQWNDLTADDLPRTAAFSAEFRRRLEREGAQTGDVQVSLHWSNYNDLDLHVICPSGEEIYFGHKHSGCGGTLDVDMNVSPTSQAPVENVFWPFGGAPRGHYRVLVRHFKNHRREGCHDPTPYRVAVKVAGWVEEFSGTISHGQSRCVREFDLDEQALAVPVGSGGGNTDLGAALRAVAEQLKTPPMPDRALPPVLVLVSDGQPTDEFEAGLRALMAEPWGKKSVRIAIAIGRDADTEVLQRFIGHMELRPLQARNSESLTRYIRWASTVVLKSASAPATQARVTAGTGLHVPVPVAPEATPFSAADPW